MSISVDESVGGSSNTVSYHDTTFAATPDDGQMIVLILFDRGGTEGTGPSGFTKGPSIGTSDWTTMWYKEASSESSAVYRITGLAADQRGVIGLILDADDGWDDTTPVSGSATGYDASTVTSLDVGHAAVGSGYGDSIGVALVSLRNDYTSETISWDESFTEEIKQRGGSSPYITGACATRIITSTVAAATLTASWTTGISAVRGVFLWFHEAAGSAPQSITPGLVTQSVTAFDPTVTPGTAYIVPPEVVWPGGMTKAEGFDPTITTGEVFITPAVVTQLVTAHDPTLTVGETFVTPALVSQLVTTFAPSVTFEQFASPDLAQSLAAAYDPIVRMILRPAATISAGGWDTGPTPAGDLDANTSDDSDATWIEATPA